MTNSKTVLITGATGAIGFGIAKLIAANKLNKVVLLARNELKAKQTVEKLNRITGNKHIFFILADVSRKVEVIAASKNWKGPLDVLINNAAATPRKREKTPEGIEMQWATNVLGYFWVMNYFVPILEKSAPSRIVNVASYWAGGLDFSDPEFNHRRYDNDTSYRQSKQADRMLSVAFAERLKEKNITVNACHPGDVPSTLASNLGFGGHETPEQGAATPVWLATSPDVSGISGKYFEHRHESVCMFSKDTERVDKLYKLCEAY
jgi:retinol dehydrogenase-13